MVRGRWLEYRLSHGECRDVVGGQGGGGGGGRLGIGTD